MRTRMEAPVKASRPISNCIHGAQTQCSLQHSSGCWDHLENPDLDPGRVTGGSRRAGTHSRAPHKRASPALRPSIGSRYSRSPARRQASRCLPHCASISPATLAGSRSGPGPRLECPPPTHCCSGSPPGSGPASPPPSPQASPRGPGAPRRRHLPSVLGTKRAHPPNDGVRLTQMQRPHGG